MMAEAIDWDDLSVATVSGQPVAPDDAWHVAVAHDDIKVVSLEQLDDMFRLSLVDAETKVWQPGMSEWVTLGEVAGLDEQPAPPPKRTHPKPPSPRSAPPPPQRAPVAVAAIPPASFFPEPLRAVSYAAPVAYAEALAPIPSLAPIASVRPLVVSQNPYPMPQRSGGFGRFIVGLALVAGVGVTLYRNDVLRDAAHSIHQEGLYAELEQKLGGPSFGTLRAVEQPANSEAAAGSTRASVTSDGTAAKAQGESAALANAVATPTPNPAQTAAASPAGSPPVVSLESLGTEKSNGSGNATSAKPEPKIAASVASVAKATAPSLGSTPVAEAASVAKAASPAEPKPAKAVIEKPAPPAPSKPESEMTPRERLNAEIAKSMLGSSTSSKKSKQASTGLKGSSEYDPLNPKL